ncbi:hypothetical protein [Pseudohongiella sp.]|nr:hypothetical protein [Pseudohongiella sp.]
MTRDCPDSVSGNPIGAVVHGKTVAHIGVYRGQATAVKQFQDAEQRQIM